MSSSDDDAPLARSNGHISASRISKADDIAMDRTASKARAAPPGLSIRNGPIEDDDAMDVDGPSTNGKRKSRSSLPKVNYKDETEDSDDDAPLAKRQKTKVKALETDSDDEPLTAKRGKNLPPSYRETALPDESSDDDQPLGARLAQKKADIEKAAAKEARSIRANEAKAKKATPKKAKKEESSDDDVPLARSGAKKRQSNGARKSNGVKAESDSDVPIARKAAAKKATPAKATAAKGKAAAAPAKKSAKAKAESEAPEDEEEEEYEWWNAPKKEDDSVKWKTLEHNGVMFPPEYQALPKNVRLLYDGKPVNLPIEAEEVACFFGAMLNSKHNVDNPVFQKNFFDDFKAVLKESGHATDKQGNKVDIKDFMKMDFEPIFNYYEQQSAIRKNRTAAEKKAIKAEKDETEAPFMYCKWDGRKEKVGNFRVEPPSLFRGRGEHPKTGKLKKRVYPEQITINIGKDAKVPEPPKGHKWKAVVHDNKATWLAMWQENINGAYKYVMLGAASAIKGQSDMKKFEKARELKKHIDKIRRDYTKDLKSEVMADRQRATAVYLIDKFALRAGNEKDSENEAETVGCCSLKYEHITLREPNTVIFDFLGKDSIRFYDEVTVEKQVFKNLKLFKKSPKTDGDDIFDRLTTTQLNNHLKNYMPGLTAKVFRTYNASFTMSTLLQKLVDHKNLTIAEKVKLYNDCNREVAILCNHKRTVGAAHEAQMEKLGDRIKGLRYQQWRTKQMMLQIDNKVKKKKGADYFARPEELTDEWILEHQKFLVEEQRTKIEKKFQKDNEKRLADGEKPFPDKERKERLKAADELAAKFKKENKSKKVEPEGRGPTVEKLVEQAKKIDDRVKTLELQAADRDGNKEVALSTSKINYIDPRLTVVFAKKFDVPIEKFFSKTLREKFSWAIKSVEDDDWEF
ncbi:eukaryotic DNA topoisomerase I [Colletotrichum phormii]|uniref:DNA topoisomerase I n=1 Tax=Colletotrichum phormii TaxID=359342 RepID=A0AAI9ZQY0_9PEZI|nr:eukaryotic DNA topoisomerase I [Colletotrichum phormii]KAK1636544.1 eukaryotic DNA topoisomerase I [Colletotrichum phormii]